VSWQLALGAAGFIGVCVFLLWAVSQEEEEPLPEPEPGCIDDGPLEAWEAGEGRVRWP
jgi:hypothetical protein